MDDHRVSTAAGGVIFNDDGHVLLIKENYGRHRYGLPGGRVDHGETPEEAVIREVREETGLEVTVTDLIGVLHNKRWDDPLLILAFRCEHVSGEPAIQDPSEIAEVGWYDPTSFPRPSTMSGPAAVKAALAKRSGVLLDRM
jgi:mutator protein MutT